MDYILKGIDPDLWYRVKVMCVIREMTIKELILGWLELAVLEFEEGDEDG